MRTLLAICLAVAAPALAAGPQDDAPAKRQGALVAALVDLAEAHRRAGRLTEALSLLDGGAALITRAEARPVDLARLELQRAKSVYYQASLAGAPYDAGIAALRAARESAGRAGDPALLADAEDLLGLALYARDFRASDHDEARALFESALRARRARGDQRGESESLFHLGLTFENRKDPSAADLRRAVELHEQALAAARAGGHDVEASYAYRHLAGQRQDAGDLDGAQRYFEESLRLREASGYAIYVAPALLALGDVWRAKGQPEQARGFYTRALETAERLKAAGFSEAARQALEELSR